MPASPATPRPDGLARLDWSLGDGADGVILELGANDMLRGIDPERDARPRSTRSWRELKEKNVKVLIAGMLASPEPRQGLQGATSTRSIRTSPPNMTRRSIRFFSTASPGHPHLTLTDGLHPNAAGVETIVQDILPTRARCFLSSLGDKPAAN